MIDPHAHHHHARTTTDHPDPAAKPTDAAVHDEHARHGGHELLALLERLYTYMHITIHIYIYIYIYYIVI